jgi:hypothetical protein
VVLSFDAVQSRKAGEVIMCMFCAAIPMSASVGTVLARKQRRRFLEAQVNGQIPAHEELPLRNLTLVATGGLIVCSAVYHLVVMPRTGMIL